MCCVTSTVNSLNSTTGPHGAWVRLEKHTREALSAAETEPQQIYRSATCLSTLYTSRDGQQQQQRAANATRRPHCAIEMNQMEPLERKKKKGFFSSSAAKLENTSRQQSQKEAREREREKLFTQSSDWFGMTQQQARPASSYIIHHSRFVSLRRLQVTLQTGWAGRILQANNAISGDRRGKYLDARNELMLKYGPQSDF